MRMEKDKELQFPRRAGGGKGLEILRISEEPGVPPTVGEWHLDSMFYNDEDSKIWKDRGLQKYHVVGKFRSDPCALGNYSWMEFDDGVFDCVCTELLKSTNIRLFLTKLL